ncbi:MAG: transcriptional regulator, partial [Anaerolineae bacterium]|nr:transcriptional regulator [Anaerolineae bacterium]
LVHHLQKLLQAGLITQQKDGASVISRANYDAMDALVDYLTGECCVDESQFEEEAA